MNELVVCLMDALVARWMNWWTNECIGGLLDGCVGGPVDGLMDELVDQ
jgi:hypothetical protein